MSSDIKIRITADTAGAIDNINELQKAGDVTGKSLSQIQKELTKTYQAVKEAAKTAAANPSDEQAARKLTEAVDEQAKAQQTLYKYIELENSSILMQNRGLKDIEQSKAKILALSKQIAQSTGDTELAQGVASSTAPLQEQIYQAERAKKAQEELNEKVKEQMALFTGDKVTTYTMQYQKLEAELRAVTKEYVQLDKKSEDYGAQSSQLESKAAKLSKEMNKLKKNIDEAGKVSNALRIKNLLKSFISAQAIVWGLRTAVNTLKKTLVEAASAASHAEETANLFNTTFEDVAYTANNVATSMSSLLGLAKSTSQEMLGLYGDMAAGYGQTQAAALAFSEQAARTVMDIASFKNLSGDMTTIAQTFASGLSGNFENFRKWGVIVTQTEVKARLAAKGLDKLTGSEYQFAKVQETLAIVTEKTANAQGDMVKTLDSTENINRRLAEANKALLETLGGSVNTVLNPLKKVWIDIASSITKAAEAQKLFASGTRNINVYDINNNANDRKDFQTAVWDLAYPYDKTGGFKTVNNSQEEQRLGNKLLEVMVKYTATSDDMIKAFAKAGTPLPDNLIPLLTSIEKDINKQRGEELALASRTERIANALADTRNLFDQMSGYGGVSLKENIVGIVGANQGNMVRTEGGANNAINLLANTVADNIALAIGQVISVDEGSFLSPVELALGKVSAETDGLAARVEQMAQFYELIYNYSWKDGELTEEENRNLEKILASYKEQNKLLEERKNLATIDAQLGTASAYGAKIDDQLMQDAIKAAMSGAISGLADNEIAKQQALLSNTAEKNSLMSLTSDPAKLKEIEKYYSGIADDIERYYGILATNIKLEDQKTKQQAVLDMEASMFPTAQVMRATGRTGRAGLGTTDALEQYNEALVDINKQMDEYEEKLREAGYSETEIADKVTESFGILEQKAYDSAEALDKDKYKDAALSGLGETGSLVSALSSGAWGDLIMMLIELVAQTEAFTQLASILTDSVLPVLNAFLEPLLPVISILSDLIMDLTRSVLYPLFPILKAISKALVLVMGLTDIVAGFIADSIKKIAGTVVYGITEMINNVIRLVNKLPFVNIGTIDNQWAKDWMNTDVFGNAEDKWDKMVDSLASIDRMSMEIADNTDPGNSEALALLKKQYEAGLFTMDEYSAQVADLTGRHWDNVGTYKSAALWKGNGTQYIKNGDTIINISGSNLSEEEMTRAIKRALEEADKPGAKNFGYSA